MRWWLAVLALIVFHTAAWAEDPAPPTAHPQEMTGAAPEAGAPVPLPTPLTEVAQIAGQLDAAARDGNGQQAEELLAKLKEWKARLSADDLYAVSRMLTMRADMLSKSGKKHDAAAAARYATDLSPDASAAWFARARHAFAANRADFNAYGEHLINGLRAWAKDPLTAGILSGRALSIAVLGAAFGFLIFAGVLAVRNLSPIAHDLQRLLPFEMETRSAAVVFGLVILSVLFTGGVMAALALLALVLAGYAGTKGRIVLAFFLALFAALPFLLPPIGQGIALANSREARAAAHFMAGGWEPEEVPILEGTVTRFPDDTALLFLLGSYYRKTGEYEAAQRYLEQAHAKDDRDVAIIMELANLHFAKAEFREAELGYKNALSLSPALFEGHFNLSRAYLEQFRTEEAEQELDAAARLNKEKTDRLLSASKTAHNSAKVASLPPSRTLPAFVTNHVALEGERIAERIWAFYLPRVGMNAWLAVAAVYLALFAAAIALWKKSGAHTICTACGAVFFPMFMKREKGGVKCDRCVAMTSAKRSTVLGPQDKIRMGIREFQGRQRNTANLLNMALPGAGSAWAGSYIAGAFLLLFTGLFAAKAFNTLILLAAGYRPAPLLYFAGWLGALAVFYLATVPFTMRRE